MCPETIAVRFTLQRYHRHEMMSTSTSTNFVEGNLPKTVRELASVCCNLETAVYQKLEDLQSNMNSQLNEFKQHMTPATDVATSGSDISFTQAVSELQKKLEAQIATVKVTIFNDLDAVRSEVSRLAATSVDHAEKLDAAEQYQRRNCLLVHGVPELRDEDIVKTVVQFAGNRLDVHLKHEDIDRCHRLGPPQPTAAQVVAGERRPRPRPIIVKFARYLVRADVWAVKRRLAKTGLLVTESLTQTRLGLYNTAKEIAGNRNAWTQDGRIIVQCPNKARLVVNCERDMAKVHAAFNIQK